MAAHRTTDRELPSSNPTESWAFFLFSFLSLNLWCVINQVPLGGAILQHPLSMDPGPPTQNAKPKNLATEVPIKIVFASIVILILMGPRVRLCKKFLRRVHPKVHLISGPPTGPPNTKPKRFCVLYGSIADDTIASSADPSEDLIIIFLTTVPFF